MKKELNGSPRRAIVTGAGSGLGRALALRLARDKWHVAVCDIDLAGAAETAALVERAGGTAQVESLDVTRPEDWAALRDRLQSEWEAVDLLVNNAGVTGAGVIGRFPLDDWRWLLDVNLFGVIHGCHFFVDWLAENPRGGHVVNTASVAGVASAPAMGAYNASKAAVISLSETLYAELRRRGVGVTVVCPGFVRTNLLSGGRWENDGLKRGAEDFFAASRLTPEHVAEATVAAIRRRRLYVVLPLRGRVLWRLKRLMPQSFMTALARLVDLPETRPDARLPQASSNTASISTGMSSGSDPMPTALRTPIP
jgi:NAD(P)-dependent dehydrogenase (short-subunit alcohol dehydrogenase family)